MSATGRVVRAGAGRRRVQTLVIALATLMAVASAVVAGSLMVASSAPFDSAFARQRGPHLTAQVDTGRADAARLAATARVPGATAVAGPYPLAVVTTEGPDGRPGVELTVAGRAGPGGALDRLTMTSGRWPSAPGEIAVSADFPPIRESALVLPGGRRLTIVGRARSVSDTAGAWVAPAQLDALRGPRSRPAAQMLYRFSGDPSKGRLASGRTALAAALPAGSLLGTQTYLDAKYAADRKAATFVPFLLAFGALGLVMAVIIVASVVGGAVGAGVRRIGVLKAIGFTPAGIVRAYVAQALLPSGAGVLLGIALGNAVAYPLLGDVQEVYGSSGLSVAWWVDLAVAAAALGVVALAALVPALRAGRLRTVEAIAVGRARGARRGRWAHRVTGRLRLPRTLSLGLAAPFAHPVRSASMLFAVAFGTAAATFAIGLAASLTAVGEASSERTAGAVTVVTEPPGPRGPARPSPATDARVRAAIRAAPGTASSYGTARTQVTVPGVVGAVDAVLYQGGPRGGVVEMISGRWIAGPGEAVVPTRFLDVTGLRIGDAVTLQRRGAPARLRIVGEAFDLDDNGMRVHADLASFASAGVAVETYSVVLKPGVSTETYLPGLKAALRPLGADAFPNDELEDATVVVLDSLAALLTLMLVGVAGLGVLNSVVLDTRERVRDLGVCKAIGMAPRQTVAMVLGSVVGIGALGGLAGLPAGVALHHRVLPLMGRGAGTGLTPRMIGVYDARGLALLALGGVAIAVLGALLPAVWAAGVRTATALRTE